MDEKRQPAEGIRTVIEAEIINPDYHEEDKREREATYTRSGPVYTQIFTTGPIAAMPNGGCLALAIPFGLFLYCLGQYGFLSGLGFVVFYLIGSVLGTLMGTRALMTARPFNPWLWRAGNWIVSFFLTLWLSGGLDG